jgi:hypothetical protein
VKGKTIDGGDAGQSSGHRPRCSASGVLTVLDAGKIINTEDRIKIVLCISQYSMQPTFLVFFSRVRPMCVRVYFSNCQIRFCNIIASTGQVISQSVLHI